MIFRRQPPQDRGGAQAEMMATLRRYGVRDERVLAAMASVPRHEFLRAVGGELDAAYVDRPVPIGHGQTLSQPFVVAHMVARLALRPGERVLEVGSGCGYVMAVLCELGVEAFGIDREGDLVDGARRALARLGYTARLCVGDGYAGWPENAPFDAIVVSCAPPEVPQALVDQLAADGGRMILPVGEHEQRLVMVRREGGGTVVTDDLPVRFVPMVRG